MGQLFLLQKANKRVEELEKALKDSGVENETLQKLVDSLQDNAAADTENAVASEVKDLRGELSGHKQRQEALTKELKDVQAENKTLKAKCHDSDARLQTLRSTVNDMKQSSQKLKAEKKAANTRNQQLGRDKNLKIKEIEAQVAAAEQKVAELENRLDRERKRT